MKQHRAMKINYHGGFLELDHKKKTRAKKGGWNGEEIVVNPPVKETYIPPPSNYIGRFSDYV